MIEYEAEDEPKYISENSDRVPLHLAKVHIPVVIFSCNLSEYDIAVIVTVPERVCFHLNSSCRKH